MYTSETFPLKLPFSPFLLLTLISLTSTLSYGQEQIKTHWSFITPKPDMEEQLGKAYKDPPTGIFSSSQYIVLRVKSGDQVGRYAVATFDEDKASEESVSGYNKTLLPLIEEISRVVTVSRRDISTWRPGIGTCETSTGSYGYAEVVFFQLNSGGEQDFVFVQEKIREAAEKTNLPVLYEWQQVVSDVKSNFILILPRNQWADFRRLEKLFESMLIEVYGREDASSLLQRLNRSIRTRNSALWNFWAGHCLMRVGAGRPSDEMPQFPWPPPKWTSRYVVIEGLVATGKYEKLVNSLIG